MSAQNLNNPVKKPRKRNRFSQAAYIILDGSFLTREKVIRLIPFILYLMLLAIVHIANSYRAEKTRFEINALKSQMDELRYHYITSKSELMSVGRQSEVVLRLRDTGLKEAVVPPVKLSSSDVPLQNSQRHE
jgi:cell division protein FtsL